MEESNSSIESIDVSARERAMSQVLVCPDRRRTCCLERRKQPFWISFTAGDKKNTCPISSFSSRDGWSSPTPFTGLLQLAVLWPVEQKVRHGNRVKARAPYLFLPPLFSWWLKRVLLNFYTITITTTPLLLGVGFIPFFSVLQFRRLMEGSCWFPINARRASNIDSKTSSCSPRRIRTEWCPNPFFSYCCSWSNIFWSSDWLPIAHEIPSEEAIALEEVGASSKGASSSYTGRFQTNMFYDVKRYTRYKVGLNTASVHLD